MTNSTHTVEETVVREVLQKMLDDRRKQLSSCERMLELLQPEWDRFEARTGHDVYVARDYADHTSAARTHRKEIAALEKAIDALASHSTPAGEDVEREDVCAQCKGMRGDLPRYREPEELCDPCYEDAERAVLRPASLPPSTHDELVEALATSLTEVTEAMRRYEMDVDADAPAAHREMMRKAHEALERAALTKMGEKL